MEQHINLNYFADDLVEEHGLDRAQLKLISNVDENSQVFRELIIKYHQLADEYRLRTYRMIQRIKSLVKTCYQLNL